MQLLGVSYCMQKWKRLYSTFLQCYLLCCQQGGPNFKGVWMKSLRFDFQIRAIFQYFPVVLFVFLHKAGGSIFRAVNDKQFAFLFEIVVGLMYLLLFVFTLCLLTSSFIYL